MTTYDYVHYIVKKRRKGQARLGFWFNRWWAVNADIWADLGYINPDRPTENAVFRSLKHQSRLSADYRLAFQLNAGIHEYSK